MDGFTVNGSGLSASIYARQPCSDGGHFIRRPGDWNCACGYLNFQRRSECLQCSSPRPSDASSKVESRDFPAPAIAHTHSHPPMNNNSIMKGGPIALKEETLHTPLQQVENSRSIHLNVRDRESEDAALERVTVTRHAQKLQLREPGLSTSRWAPRNLKGGQNSSNSNQVWTRTSYQQPQKAQPDSALVGLPDLGLPYEVQHFILHTMQRILEEGCYAFATRWIPELLYKKRWTCAEQVELKTWRDELPSLIPPNAIVSQLNYPLSAALRDAVAVRNSAAHRHLCDNLEIKKMSLQGSSLMAMFRDKSREGKFHQIWDALHEWDTDNLNSDAKKDKLEHALQEISERPMNDMDWSPNAISLEEIPSQDVEAAILNTDDPMDMD